MQILYAYTLKMVSKRCMAYAYIIEDDIQIFRKHGQIDANMALPQRLSNNIFETLSH